MEQKFVQKTIEHADIRYLNLLSIMEAEGYGMYDSFEGNMPRGK
jgi:hypothetical protein